jgi:Fe-S cluster biosynthesis and repair protein YggX
MSGVLEGMDYPCVMVMNEMRLDMSLPEHRKLLRKYERMFFGLEKPEGELQKNPDKQPDEPR